MQTKKGTGVFASSNSRAKTRSSLRANTGLALQLCFTDPTKDRAPKKPNLQLDKMDPEFQLSGMYWDQNVSKATGMAGLGQSWINWFNVQSHRSLDFLVFIIFLKIFWSYVKGTLLLFNSLSLVKFSELGQIKSQFPHWSLDTDGSKRRFPAVLHPAAPGGGGSALNCTTEQ